MSFEYAFAYEDRGQVHTSRWLLDGISTKAGASNVKDGRLWAKFTLAGAVVAVDLYKDPGCDAVDKVASGNADVTDIDAAAVMCSLAEANSSGISGELYFETYTADPPGAVEVLVCLCTDTDLADEHAGLADLPIYNSALGMARYCAVATRKVLLLASQRYGHELGGFGAPEHRYRAAASRGTPDFRRLANPDQLKDAAVHWALMLAFGACHERADETMYSQLRDYHDAKRAEAIDAWNITFNTNPDSNEDADVQKSAGMVRVTRA